MKGNWNIVCSQAAGLQRHRSIAEVERKVRHFDLTETASVSAGTW